MCSNYSISCTSSWIASWKFSSSSDSSLSKSDECVDWSKVGSSCTNAIGYGYVMLALPVEDSPSVSNGFAYSTIFPSNEGLFRSLFSLEGLGLFLIRSLLVLLEFLEGFSSPIFGPPFFPMLALFFTCFQPSPYASLDSTGSGLFFGQLDAEASR
jgi:hypothetical protein